MLRGSMLSVATNSVAASLPASPACGEKDGLSAGTSVRELAEDVVDVGAPRAMEQGEFALGGGFIGLGEFDQRFEEAAFVGALAVPARTALQAGDGDLQCFQREVAHRAITERQLQGMPRHAVSHLGAPRQAEVL